MIKQVAHSKPWITNYELTTVASTLTGGMLAQGQSVQQLEQRLAHWLGADDGVAVGSGSAAIVLALTALDVGPKSDVIVPTYICRSVIEAILTVGARPLLCDVGPDWVVTRENVRDVITPRTRAIVAPHMYGIFADIASLREFEVPIIEDCAQALDGNGIRTIKGDVAVLSFHPTKCLTAGEGGMALAGNSGVSARMRSARDGANDRILPRLFSPLSDVAASLAHAQLDRYSDALSRRSRIAARYMQTIGAASPHLLNMNAFSQSMFFRFPVKVPGGINAYREPFSRLGINVRQGVDALAHRQMQLDDRTFPTSVHLFQTTISVPIYPALEDNELDRCISAVEQLLL